MDTLIEKLVALVGSPSKARLYIIATLIAVAAITGGIFYLHHIWYTAGYDAGVSDTTTKYAAKVAENEKSLKAIEAKASTDAVASQKTIADLQVQLDNILRTANPGHIVDRDGNALRCVKDVKKSSTSEAKPAEPINGTLSTVDPKEAESLDAGAGLADRDIYISKEFPMLWNSINKIARENKIDLGESK